MTGQTKPPRLQAILQRRQQEEFVGRAEQIALFRQNLALPLNDDQRRFIFSVSGQGGVGKTWLLRRFRRIAEEAEAITAWTPDEAAVTVSGAASSGLFTVYLPLIHR